MIEKLSGGSRNSNGTAAAEIYEALEKLGGINEENVKLLPKPLRTRGFAALKKWKKRNPQAAASMTERGHDACRRYLCHFILESKQRREAMVAEDGSADEKITFSQLKGQNYLNSETHALSAINLVIPEPAWV